MTSLQFLHRVCPYENRKHNHFSRISLDIESGKQPAERPGQVDALQSASWDILEECWERDPDKRATAPSVRDDLEILRKEVELEGLRREAKARRKENKPIRRPEQEKHERSEAVELQNKEDEQSEKYEEHRRPEHGERKGMKAIEDQLRQLRLELTQKDQRRQLPIARQEMTLLMKSLQTLFGFYAIAYMSYLWASGWLLWNWTSGFPEPLRWLFSLGGVLFLLWTLNDISIIVEQLIPGVEHPRSNKVLGWHIGGHILGEGILIWDMVWYHSTEVWPPMLWPLYFSFFMTLSLAATHAVQVTITRNRRHPLMG